MLHLLLQLSVSAGVCPQGQTKVDTFTYNGTDWLACEDLSTHGGALVLVNKDGKVLTYELSSLFSSFPLLHAAPNLRLFLFLKKEPAMHCVDVLTCESAVSIHTKDCDVMQLCINTINASLAQNVFSRTQRCLLSIPLPFPKQPLTAVLAWG